MEKEHEIKTVVPALRFPEFTNMGNWKIEILSNISSRVFDGIHQTPKYVNEGIPFYSVENIVSNKNNKYISEEDYLLYSSTNKVEKGDILISRIGTIGKSVVVNWDYRFYIYVTLAAVKKTNKFNSYFLSSFFQSEFYQKEILSKSLLNAVPCKINMEELRRTRILLPETREQQKIADCLSSLDDLIEATNRKIEVLKEHKKGLMQRLFPKEGKNVPELRFPEFQETKGWAKKQIIDLGEVITGNTPSKKEGKYWNGDFAWITAQDFKGKYINDSILKLTRFGKNKARVIPQNSVLVTCIASIGLNAINKIECSTNQQINTICCNRKYHYEYVYYLITYNVKRLKQLAGQTAVPIITKKNFEEFEVYTVENYDEQQKIADCLSSLDELIEATSQKVEILKEHKKGLMQQLFPKI